MAGAKREVLNHLARGMAPIRIRVRTLENQARLWGYDKMLEELNALEKEVITLRAELVLIQNQEKIWPDDPPRENESRV